MSTYPSTFPAPYPNANISSQHAKQAPQPTYNHVPQQYLLQENLQQHRQYPPVPPLPHGYSPKNTNPLSPVASSNVPPIGYPQIPNYPQQTGYHNPNLPQVAPHNGYYTVRVIAGTHRGTRCIFRAGDTFRTKDPLHLMFENKFQLVPDAINVIEDSAVVPDRMIPKTPEEVAAARLNSAIQQGVHNAAPNNPAPALLQPQAIPVDESPNNVSYPFTDAENVSKRFPKASKNGMEIWKHDEQGYAINMIDPANPDFRFNLADTELKTITDVNKYLISMGY